MESGKDAQKWIGSHSFFADPDPYEFAIPCLDLEN